MTDFPGKGKVAVLKTSPGTVLEDIEKLMKIAGFEQSLPKDVRTGIKSMCHGRPGIQRALLLPGK